jgi:hypothetical protein
MLAPPLYNRSPMTDHTGSLSRCCEAALTDPHWRSAPTERDPDYFRAWQRVSLALQRWLRDRISDRYFEDLARFADRPAAYPMIVYRASRLCHGRPGTEFTYDLRDYPECRTTLAASWNLSGRAIQAVLRGIEERLHEAGLNQLAHRYAPVWHQDVLEAVKKKPETYVDLLMTESALINAAIDLGTARDLPAAHRFRKTAHLNLRKLCGMDLENLGVGILSEATRILAHADASGVHDFSDTGALQDRNVRSPGSPDARIADEKDRDNRRPHGGCQVGDAGIIADIDPRRGDPARHLV